MGLCAWLITVAWGIQLQFKDSLLRLVTVETKSQTSKTCLKVMKDTFGATNGVAVSGSQSWQKALFCLR